MRIVSPSGVRSSAPSRGLPRARGVLRVELEEHRVARKEPPARFVAFFGALNLGRGGDQEAFALDLQHDVGARRGHALGVEGAPHEVDPREALGQPRAQGRAVGIVEDDGGGQVGARVLAVHVAGARQRPRAVAGGARAGVRPAVGALRHEPLEVHARGPGLPLVRCGHNAEVAGLQPRQLEIAPRPGGSISAR